VPAGGVEGSRFCLFSVVLPAKCVSSISPRFHYRRLAFCFLPLAAILESTVLTSVIGPNLENLTVVMNNFISLTCEVFSFLPPDLS
jgi:hypothetical protein